MKNRGDAVRTPTKGDKGPPLRRDINNNGYI